MFDQVQQLVGLIMVPGRFGLRVSIDLLMRTLYDNMQMSFIDVLNKIDLFSWAADEVGNITIGPRHPLEAEIVSRRRLGGPKYEIDFMCKLIRNISHKWDFRRNRYHPQHEFDRLIKIIARDLGRDGIDPKKFSNTYYSRWIKELEIMESYDFEIEARKLIERAILEDTRPKMPIDGGDIMQEFSLSPGKEVGDLLKRAMEIFDDNPSYSRDELLELLGKP